MNSLRCSIATWLLAATVLAISSTVVTATDLTNLRCESRVDPLGIDAAQPRLSWVMVDPEARGQRQTAYQVLVASSEKLLEKDQGDLWDSGKVASGQTIQVEYAGQPLAAQRRCHWKVRVWDKEGKPTAWSRPAVWEMGLLALQDWQAQWLNDGKPQPTQTEDFYREDPAPLFRKRFTCRRKSRGHDSPFPASATIRPA